MAFGLTVIPQATRCQEIVVYKSIVIVKVQPDFTFVTPETLMPKKPL